MNRLVQNNDPSLHTFAHAPNYIHHRIVNSQMYTEATPSDVLNAFNTQCAAREQAEAAKRKAEEEEQKAKARQEKAERKEREAKARQKKPEKELAVLQGRIQEMQKQLEEMQKKYDKGNTLMRTM